MKPPSGYLLVDKPLEWTSFDVVNKLRRTIQNDPELNITAKKRFPVGHAGTLDPLATGLLIIMVGEYTKKAAEFTKMDKSYAVEAVLGQTSSTGDEEGEKTEISKLVPAKSEIDAVLKRFIGQIEQLPPQYSAIKVNGQRAYDLARAGKTAELKPRPVKIYVITDVKYDYPKLYFTVKVSSGTYIRSLVSDIGEALKTGAYTRNLRRLTIGEYSVEQAQAVDKLDAAGITQSLRQVS